MRTFWHQRVPGGWIVIFDVIERPLLTDVLFVGCHEIHKKVLQKEANIKKGDAADPYAVEEARHKIEDLYHKRGFTRARVSLLEGNKPEDRRADLPDRRGSQAADLEHRFRRQHDRRRRPAEDPNQVEARRSFGCFGGEFDRKQLDEDVERLTAYYRGLGFFRARIGREYSSTRRKLGDGHVRDRRGAALQGPQRVGHRQYEVHQRRIAARPEAQAAASTSTRPR